jgi:putative ABC transport system ATP-binding protein
MATRPAAEHTSPVVVARALQRSFRDGTRRVHALRGVDLTLHAGECVALMGASGSGKTTLLNILAGIDRPDSGSVTVLGLDLLAASARRIAELRLRRIGYVFQNINLLPDLSLLENVALPLEAVGVRGAAAKAKAKEQLAAVDVEHLQNRYPGEVSGGERQRAAIARATAGERRLLLADEPTGALDSDTGASVMEAILRICSTGVAALIGTHNPAIAAATDRTVTMRDGLLTEGKPEPKTYPT